MQSDFLLSDNPKRGTHSFKNKRNVNNNNSYKVTDRQNREKKSNYNRSNQTPRLDSVNGLSMLSDNLPGSSMSVADITLTMSNDEGRNVVCLEQTAPRLDSGVEDDFSASSLFPPSPCQFLSSPTLYPSSSHIQQCTDPLCEGDSCPWHKCILKSPQYVRWKPNTITIELKRPPNTRSFGFYPKAKIHSHADKKTKDFYVLVKKVDAGGLAALAGLAVGDFLRSVNHVALHSNQEYDNFVNSTLRHADKLMMQIQRPENISVKDSAILEQSTIAEKSAIPLTKPVSPSTSPDVKFPSSSPASEAIPLRPVVRSKVKSYLPQARLVVCGNRTNEFMRCFMGGFLQFPVESHASYHYLSLESRQHGSAVAVSNSKSFSCMTREPSQDSINVDFISVASDNFFHHCCPWIFSPDSIFVLTFDVKRLAQFSEVEMARLSSLKRTVHSNGSGLSERLKLVGVVLPGEDVPLDEIRTLFYTSLGETLPEPDFVPISGAASTKEMKHFRAKIFQSLKEISSQSQVVSPALKAMDCLISHQKLTITNQELSSALTNWNIGSDIESLTSVISDLKRTGNLLSTCHLPQTGTNQELIVPSKLFDCLVHVTTATDKIQIPASGIISRSRLVESLDMLTSDPIKLLTCLEDLGVVYTVQVKGQDSGFFEEIGVMFPFLLEEVPFGLPAEGCHELLTIHLPEPLASSRYLSWLSKLSGFCHRFEMLGQTASRFLLEGLDITCVWAQGQRQICLMEKRASIPLAKANTSSSGLLSQLQRVESCLQASLGVLCSSYTLHWSEDRVHRNTREAVRESIDSMGDIQNEQRYIHGVNLLEQEARDFLPLLGAVDGGGEELETLRVLVDCAIATVPHLTLPLRRMLQHLSIDNAWEVLASFLGQTTRQVRVYSSMIAANPNRLPAETFYLHFTHETQCSLGDILNGLLQMSETDSTCWTLAENLVTAAFQGYTRHTNRN